MGRAMPTATVEMLEARILYSADLVPVGDASQLLDSNGLHDESTRELVFVDASLDDIEALLSDLNRQIDDGRALEIILLDPDADGIAQIGDALSGGKPVSTIHVLTHGQDGAIALGATRLDADSLLARSLEIAGWGDALSADADFLIYGCDVAANGAGRQLITDLSQLTGADVAASDDLTGSLSKGGDWTLEFEVGTIDSVSAVSPWGQLSWQGALGSVTADTTNDVADGDTSSLANLLANRGADGKISLREAIIAANNTAGADTISLGAGTYSLSIAGLFEDAAAQGDLDITSDITIQGAGAGQTTISASGISDRVFDVKSGATLTISDLTVSDVNTTNQPGGAVYNLGTFSATDVVLENNTTVNNAGAGLFNAATATLTRVSIYGNSGSGVFQNAGTLAMTNVTVSGNTSLFDGAGLAIVGGSATIEFSTIASNATTFSGSGGGIFVNGGSVTLSNSIVADNTSQFNGADITGAVTSAGHNIVENYSGFTLDGTDQSADPGLAAVAVDPGSGQYVHAISSSSIAYNAADVTAPATDQRGVARDANPDIGAYEYGLAVPVNTVPGAQSTSEDTPLVFSVGNGNALSVSDPDAGGNPVEVTLSVTNGALTLAGTTGLSFTDGDGTADVTMTFRGTVTDINNALNGLSYTPTANDNGGATLTIATLDGSLLSLDIDTALVGRYTFDSTGALGDDTSPAAGNAGTPVNVSSVNDATRGDVLGLSGTGSVQVSGLYGMPGSVSVSAWVNLTTADTNGAEVISLGNIVGVRLDQGGKLKGFYNDGSTYNFTEYATTLAGSGWHHVAFSIDSGSNTQVLYLDGTAVATSNSVTAIDWGAAGGGPDSFIGTHGAGVPGYDFTGLIDEVRIYNRALGASDIEVLASDQNLLDTDSVAIAVNAVNDAPTATITPASYNATEQTPLTLHGTGLSIADIDDGGAGVQATVSVVSGTLSAAAGSTGVSVSGSGSNSITLTGTVTQINNLLAGNSGGTLSYVINSDAPPSSDTLTLQTNDLGNTGSGGALTGSDAATINITAVNDAPVITSDGGGATASLNAAENQTSVTTVTATDADVGDTLTYSIAGGADAAKFSIDSSTGVLSFNVAPNFESPTDVGADNIYDLTVQVSDGTTTDTQAIAVTVTNVNEAPTLVSLSNSSIAENTDTSGGTSIGTLSTTDPDAGDSTSYTIVGGADAAKFSIGGGGSDQLILTDGVLDFETQSSYAVTVRITDSGGLTRDENFTVSVTNVNEAPSFVSAAVTGATQDTAYSYSITTSDPDAGATLTITAPTLPAWLTLTDNGDGTATLSGTPTNAEVGTHAVSLQVSDGSLSATQNFTLTVSNTNDAPVITSDGGGATASLNAAENQTSVTTVTATDADVGDTLTYSIAGGADAAKFSIDSSTGVLSFNVAPNFESPTDVGADNIYDLTVQVSDGTTTDTQAISVTVTNVNEAPTLISLSNSSIAENTDTSGGTSIGTLSTTDPDAGDSTSYGIVGGADAAKFSIGGGGSDQLILTDGVLDFETQSSYAVTVRITDGGGLTRDENVTVSVTNVNEAPSFVSSAVTGATQDTAYSYSITTSDPDAGATLTITAPTLPAWLTLTDNSDGTATLSGTPTNAEVGTHAVSLQVSDGSLTATQNFTLTVSSANSVPVITSDGGGTAAALSRTDPMLTVTTVVATDADPADVLSFQILGGNDASSFTLDASSGELRFATLPGGLPPADANGDSVYEVIVGVSDGRGGADAQALSVTLNVSVPPELPPAWVPPTPPVEDATPDPAPAEPSAEAAETVVPQEDVGARATEASTPVGETLASVPPAEHIAAVAKAPSAIRVEVAAVNLVSAQMPVFDVRMLDIDVNALATGADGDSSPDQAVVLSPELQQQIETAGDSARLTVAIVGGAGTVITVGVVWWVTRVGALVATLVASLPAWRSIDPLPILRQVRDPAAMALEEDGALDSGPRRDVVVEDGCA